LIIERTSRIVQAGVPGGAGQGGFMSTQHVEDNSMGRAECIDIPLDPGFRETGYHRFGKRAFDLLVGTALFLATLPVVALAWVAVRLTSPGPGFFGQERVGHHGKFFRCYKLRSMYIDQESRIDMEELRAGAAEGLLVKMENDPRVTPVGSLIRKLSIDELPQLWNVVRGDMSLVGPRPLMPHMVAPYPDLNARRCMVRPGITGEWQVEARDDNRSLLGMIKHDFHYIENCTFGRDLLILLKTVSVVSSTRGAH
jgi:exopolysaccharide production protein ExoY